MRDLQGIAEINGPRRVELQAERAANILDNHSIAPAVNARREHGDRVAARNAVNNTPFLPNVPAVVIDLPGVMELYGSAIDQKPGSPFMEFWLELNEQRDTEVGYGEASRLFKGGPTPANALTFVEKGDGIRAIPAPPVNGMAAWYAEFREITGKGTKWHRVSNANGDPITYTTPVFALNAAVWAKGNAIQNAFR